MDSALPLIMSFVNPPTSKGAKRNAGRLGLLFLKFLLADKLTQVQAEGYLFW